MHKISSPSTPLTLRAAILQSKNSLNFIRFVLAALVIWGHAYPLTSGGNSRVEFISAMAVNLFFCISGFLILASAQRSGPLSYLWRRFLRIFPGYWVSLFFVIVVAVPISYLLGTSQFAWDTEKSLGYFWENFNLYNLQFAIEGTQIGLPYQAWNGSTWTLWYEFVAYLCLIPLAYLPYVRNFQRVTITVAFVGSLLMYPVLDAADATTTMYWSFARLVPMFLAGSLLYVWGDYIKVRKPLVVVAVVLTIILHYFDNVYLMNTLHLIFAYGVLGLAAILKIYWGYKNDLSYGVYIYAFPVQQLFIAAGTARYGIAINTFLTLVVAMGLAYLSWNLVEKPSLSLKRLLPTHR